MVPAYTLPDNLENFVVMRIVVRQGMSRDMADMLLGGYCQRDCRIRKTGISHPGPHCA